MKLRLLLLVVLVMASVPGAHAQCYLLNANSKCEVCWKTVYGDSTDKIGSVPFSLLALACSRLLSLALACSRLPSLALACSRLLSLALACSCLLSLALACSRLLSRCLTCYLPRSLVFLLSLARHCLSYSSTYAESCVWTLYVPPVTALSFTSPAISLSSIPLSLTL